MSSAPLPHSKCFIPLEYGCYYGNCSNKNKYPLADFDLSEIRKFVNKHTRKEWVKPAYLLNNNLFVTTHIKKWSWPARKSWFHIIVPFFSGKSMTCSQCENILWVCFDGLPSPPSPKLPAALLWQDLPPCPALWSRRQIRISQSGQVHHSVSSLWDVFLPLRSDIWTTRFYQQHIDLKTQLHQSVSGINLDLSWQEGVIWGENVIKAKCLPSLSTWSRWTDFKTHRGWNTD